MDSNEDRLKKTEQLRLRADARARATAAALPVDLQRLSPGEAARLLQELRVHQIELEVQNEELRRAHAELDVAQARYYNLYNLAPVAHCSTDGPGLITDANLTAARLLGVAQRELAGQPLSLFISADDQGAFLLLRLRLAEGGPAGSCELRMLRQDGSQFWAQVQVGAGRAADGTAEFRIVLSDISERKKSEARARHVGQLYEALVQSNSAVVRCANEAELFPEICRVAVTIGGMKMAWIGVVDDASHAVRAVASYGDDQGYLDGIRISAGRDAPFAYGPTGTAIRENRPFWCQDFAADPRTAAWHALGARSGWAASAALPLCRDGKPIGALNLYAGEVEAFSEDIRELLIGMVADIGAALNGYAREARRKAAEAALQGTVRRYHAVLSNLHGGILLVSNLDTVEYANQEFCDIFGLREAPEHLSGWSATELLGRISGAYMDASASLARISAVVAGGQAVFEEELPLAGGRIYLRDYVPIVLDGQAQGRLWFHRDVTERQHSRQMLRESEARFRMLAEDAPVMIWMTGPDHRYMFVNRALLAFTGRTPEEQMAVRWDADSHPDDLARGREAIDGAAHAHVPFTFEYRRRRHDGEYRWIHTKGMPRFDQQGGFAGYIGTLSDITESKLAEQVLKESAVVLEQRVAARTAELETANRELEAFSYSVSHDLRAPVRHMVGFAVLAKEALPDTEQSLRRHLEAIIRAAGRMAALIDDLLALSRTNRAELSIQQVELEALVRDVAGECVRDTGSRRIALRIGSLPPVRGDPALLRQVFVNLIGNAVKFTARREEALIEIFAEPSGEDDVRLCVRDNGAGFDMQYADRLFGVFERLHPKDEFEGTGIGLAIVKRIVERHGGSVWVEAKPDLGAAFHLVLPHGRVDAAPAG